MSQQGYFVSAEYLKDGRTTIVWFNDNQEADLYAGNLRKTALRQVIVNVGSGPLYRVEWRDRASGKTGVADGGWSKSRAENIAESLDLDHPSRDHWIAVVGG